MCRNIRIQVLSWPYMYTCIQHSIFLKHFYANVIETNPRAILRHIFVQITFETRKRNKDFMF